jgi:hypothetical protein
MRSRLDLKKSRLDLKRRKYLRNVGCNTIFLIPIAGGGG